MAITTKELIWLLLIVIEIAILVYFILELKYPLTIKYATIPRQVLVANITKG